MAAEAKVIDKKLAICDIFNKQVFNIFKLASNKAPNNPDIDRLKRIISYCRETWPPFMIERCKDKIWSVRKQIIDKDEDYFLNRKYDEFIKKDENQRFIETLIEMVQDSSSHLSKEEKEYIWSCVNTMLQNCLDYKLLTGDHS